MKDGREFPWRKFVLWHHATLKVLITHNFVTQPVDFFLRCFLLFLFRVLSLQLFVFFGLSRAQKGREEPGEGSRGHVSYSSKNNIFSRKSIVSCLALIVRQGLQCKFNWGCFHFLLPWQGKRTRSGNDSLALDFQPEKRNRFSGPNQKRPPLCSTVIGCLLSQSADGFLKLPNH